MKHKAPLVRRSRKTAQSRRLKKLDEDLESNLHKVENRLFVQGRNATNVKVFVPKEVRRGVITPDLHELARKYAPEALAKQEAQERKAKEVSKPTEAKMPAKRIGFLRLRTIHTFIHCMLERKRSAGLL